MILGSIRIRKEHPQVLRFGPAGAIEVMLAYGVDAVHPEKLYDIGWALAYDVVPSTWITGWWTEVYEGGLVHKVYGRHWTHDARPEVTAADARAALEHFGTRANPSRSAYPYHFDQSVLVPRDIASSPRQARSIAKRRTGQPGLRTEPGPDYWHVPMLEPELMRPGSYVTRPAGHGVQVRSARFKPEIEREPMSRRHDGSCHEPHGRERLVCHEEYAGDSIVADVRMTRDEFQDLPDRRRSIRQLADDYGRSRITTHPRRSR